MTSQAAAMTKAGSVYAGFWRRVAAALIDSVIWMIIYVITFAVLGGGMTAAMLVGGGNPEGAVVGVLALRIGLGMTYFAYKIGLECSPLQATLGKMALGIVVTDMDGERVSFVKSFLRNWLWWLPAIVKWAGIAVVSPEQLEAMTSAVTDPSTTVMASSNAVSITGQVLGFVAVISCLVVGFTTRKQGLHDITAQALVLRKSAF